MTLELREELAEISDLLTYDSQKSPRSGVFGEIKLNLNYMILANNKLRMFSNIMA